VDRPRPDQPGRVWALTRLVVMLLLSAASYFLFSHYVWNIVEVSGHSMDPTLQPGDRFLLSRWAYWGRAPQRGDLVVLNDPVYGEACVKRVVGLPGETLRMKRNIAYVNGSRLMEPYLPKSALATEDAVLEREMRVPEGCYFVMGDNRDNSEDSRRYGPVPRRAIVGSIGVGAGPRPFVRTEAVDRAGLLPTLSVAAAEPRPPAPDLKLSQRASPSLGLAQDQAHGMPIAQESK
jgi:signal peptidase I